MPEEYPEFSDFSEDVILDGDKLRIDEILNKRILVKGFLIRDSHQKKGTQYVTIQYDLDGTPHVTFTASGKLMDQLNKYKDKIPFYATIRKINRSYSFS